ncbi:MAG: hypothetical protein ABI992_10870 [Chthoniobacterales bacterium]
MEASFEKLLVLLAKSDLRFIVVGGVAVTIQGYVRLTEDIDLLVDATEGNLACLLQTLAAYGEGFARELSAADFTDEEGAIRIVEETEQMQIDVFTVMRGRRFAEVLADADRFEAGGFSIAVASKRSLIGWKEQSQREKDHLDAIALRRLLVDPAVLD